MSKLCRLIFILIFIPFLAASQSVIRGVVFDNIENTPVSGAVITLLDEKDEIIAYDISSGKGEFNLSIEIGDKKIVRVTRMLGYKDDRTELENKSLQQNIFLEQTPIMLTEVTIRSRPVNINEDTLKYSVNTFKSAGDRTIGDVLRKMPGIEVTESGGIKYKGEPINKFYIEGLDLLENKYGIATNNIAADAVQNVEVIENHQSIKSIKGMISSAQAAINLKLKEEKMARPVGGVRAGSGYSNEINWLVETFALQATRKRQTLAMYKTNNYGVDIGDDLNEHVLSINDLQNPAFELQKDLLEPASLGILPIEKERYLFNKTHVASVNNLWKTGADSQLRININYLNDVETQDTYLKSEYFLPDSTLKIVETNELTQRNQLLDGAITFTENSRSNYFENTLKWKLKRENNNSLTGINDNSFNQHFDMPATLLQNQLNYLKTWDEKIFHISSFIAYTNQPEHLTISTNGYPEQQQIGLSGFYTKTNSYYSWYWGLSALLLNGVVEASYNNLNTNLTHLLYTDSVQSALLSKMINVELSPMYTYKTEKTTLEIELPVKQVNLFNTDQLNIPETKMDRFILLNSRVSLTRKFHPFFTTRLNYRYTQNIGDFIDYLDAYLMKNYRSFYKPAGIIGLSKNHSFSLYLNYRNPLSTLFANALISYIPAETNKTIAQRFVGIQSVSSDVMSKNKSNMWIGQIYTGKYFSSIKTNISLTTDYNYYQTSRYQQGELFPFSVITLGLMLKSNTKISDLLTFVYQVNYLNHQSIIRRSDISNTSTLKQFGQLFKTYFSPAKNLQFNIQVEQSYNELGENSSVDMLFANIGLNYKLKNIDLDLNWNNIFNKKEYAYSLFNGLDTYTYKYGIRPMNIMLILSFKF